MYQEQLPNEPGYYLFYGWAWTTKENIGKYKRDPDFYVMKVFANDSGKPIRVMASQFISSSEDHLFHGMFKKCNPEDFFPDFHP